MRIMKKNKDSKKKLATFIVMNKKMNKTRKNELKKNYKQKKVCNTNNVFVN